MAFRKPSLTPTKILLSLSICVSSMVSLPTSASACQAGNPACVLPVRDPAPAPPPPPPSSAPIVDDDGGFGFWPFLIGLAALAALILLLSGGGDGDEAPISP
jgi:hypothetical protein